MTNRMMEKRKAQKASLSHSSLQSCRHTLVTLVAGGDRRLRDAGQVLTDRQEDTLKVILDQMMKMTDAERWVERGEDSKNQDVLALA